VQSTSAIKEGKRERECEPPRGKESRNGKNERVEAT